MCRGDDENTALLVVVCILENNCLSNLGLDWLNQIMASLESYTEKFALDVVSNRMLLQITELKTIASLLEKSGKNRNF